MRSPIAGWEDRPASVRVNVIANFASQMFVVAAAFAMLPVYFRQLGAEAYGLVGFFALLSAWFQILDAGMSLTLSRECARYRGGALSAASLAGLVTVLELVFAFTALAGAVAIIAGAHLVATTWLRLSRLPLHTVTVSITLMGLTVPLQWAGGLYRGILTGFERQVGLSIFNAVVGALRFFGAGVAILVLGSSPIVFFGYQLVISAVELSTLVLITKPILPVVIQRERRWPARAEIMQLMKFSASLAFAISIWTLITQFDKLILSKLLTLANYGVFSLASAAAGSILLLSGPFAQALLPRMTGLLAVAKHEEADRLYRGATQILSILVAPAALFLGAFARPILFVWTGDVHLAETAARILTPYAFGNGIMALAAFPYYLQYAQGNLRLHVIGNVMLGALTVPVISIAASAHGAVGAGYGWLGLSAVYFVLWVPFVHHRLAPRLMFRWHIEDVFPIAVSTAGAAWLLAHFVVWPENRLLAAAALGLCGIVLLGAAAIGSSLSREYLLGRLQRRTITSNHSRS